MRTRDNIERITDTFVKALPIPEKGHRIHYEREVRGFGVRVTAAGIKSFIWRFRNQHGRERLITIGRCSEWTATAARKEAERMRGDVNRGDDPMAERQEARDALTVNQVLDKYEASARFARKAENTQAIDKGRLTRHVRPLLGNRLVQDLRVNDVEKAFADIAAGKTSKKVKTKKRGLARVTGGEGTARKAIRLLAAALTWAMREELIDSNPAAGAEVGSDGRRDLTLDADGYAALFKTLDAMEADKSIHGDVADAIRVIALTGARRGEIVGLQRQYVDVNRGVIVLPPTRHKTGKSTGDDRIIVLPKEAREIVQRQPEGDVLFDFDTSVISKTWRDVRAKAKLPPGIGLHGLRHSVASHLAMGGATAAEIMAAMGHRQMSTSQKYIHWALEGREALAERAASVAAGAMSKRPE